MFQAAAQIQEWQIKAGDSLPEGLLDSATPVVLKGYIKHWPIVEKALQSDKAIQDYLLADYNDSPVHVMRGKSQDKGRLFYNEDLSGFNFNRENKSLSQVFSELQDNLSLPQAPTVYVGSTAIDSVFPTLRQSNDLGFLKQEALASIWMGNQTRIAAHYDAPDNIACVIAGKRRFTLFPPEQLPNLYVGPIDFTPAGQPASLVDFHEPDFQKYPKFKTAIEASSSSILEPGDAIYIPSNWWHHVEGLSDFNVLINYWWRQVGNHVGVPNDALLHAILSIKALPKTQRDNWREIFDHYIFSDEPHNHIPDAIKGVLGDVTPLNARKLRAMLVNKLNR